MTTIRALSVALAAVALLNGAAGIAQAQPRRPIHRHYRRPPPPAPAWGYNVPTYVEAPPPVVYAPPAPPPVVYTPGLSLNVTIR